MNKKILVILIAIFALLVINAGYAQEIDNSTQMNVSDDTCEIPEDVYSSVNDADNQTLQADDSLIDTHIDVASNTTLNVVGEPFKVKLLDSDNKSISNAKITFSINGLNYKYNTDKNGIASIPIKLKDGKYKVTAKFAGNSKYKSCSKTTTIVMKNTKVVAAGLSNAEIQKIINNAKDGNIILFEGSNYDNVNLVINKRLTLISNSNTVLRSSSNSPVILITGKGSSKTTIKGFDISGADNGIEIRNSDYVIISNNNIKSDSNGILALNVNYLNVTGNDLVGNGKNGISLCNSSNSHIYNNKISSNGLNGVLLAKTDKIYIYSNTISNNGYHGIYITNKANGIEYDEGPKNLYISKNTINKNKNGIFVNYAGNNININMNTIVRNSENGILITKIGNNKIQSNEISHSIVGVKFADEYLLPDSQDVSYNVIHHTSHVAVEAKDTYYYDFGEPLKIGDNWYTDNKLLCPKVQSNNLKFVVTQVGANKFQATFYDSNGQVASLLPDRELTYETADGKSQTITLSGGTGVFTVDASNGDLIRTTVDDSHRNKVYQSDVPESSTENGVTPTYDYPEIQYDPIYDEVGNDDGSGNGNGNGRGNGNGGNSNYGGSGNSADAGDDNIGNSTQSQGMPPSASSNNPISNTVQSSSVQTASSQVGASSSGSSADADSGSGSQSVVKQIVFDEDEFVKITGISFIVLLIILTIMFYYREDIREMKSKM